MPESDSNKKGTYFMWQDVSLKFIVRARIVSLMLFLPTLLFAEIIESNSMNSILKYVHKDCLVVFDLDNTLIESTTQLGSAQWGDHLGFVYSKTAKSIEEIDTLIADSWCKVQPLITVRCVDSDAPNVVAELHKQEIVLIGLTSRRPQEIHHTQKQLDHVQIAMSKILDDNALEDTHHLKTIIFHQGIIYCTPLNKKSDGLRLFLEKLHHSPQRIIFIDDKPPHIKDIALLVESLGIEYVGIRFGGADERVASFNPDIAKIQWDCLPLIISDDEARQQSEKATTF